MKRMDARTRACMTIMNAIRLAAKFADDAKDHEMRTVLVRLYEEMSSLKKRIRVVKESDPDKVNPYKPIA